MLKSANKPMSFLLTISLIFNQLAFANNITIDTNAPLKNQATLKKARNGISVINIVTPNKKGLSHNKFTDYNVDKKGLILNNSNKRETSTKLAGYIYGNKNLAHSNTAKVILNEVTSKNKTHLKGYTEVAGDKASVVVANPNGIYINGAGFINVHKATIATANPNIKNQSIYSYRTNKGLVYIDGKGLDGKESDYTKIYANAIKLNAKIHANDLSIIAGDNTISKDGVILSHKNKNIALDSSALGGIYAKKIKLIGNSDGLGVNLPIQVLAEKDLKINSNGSIVLKEAYANKNIDIDVKKSLTLDTIKANNIKLNAKNKITNKNSIYSKSNIDINTKNLINEGKIVSKDINLNSHEEINNNSLIHSDNFLNINSNSFINSGAVVAKDMQISTKTLSNFNTIYSKGNMNLFVKDTLLNKTDNTKVDLGKQKAVIFAKDTLNIKGDKNNLKTKKIINHKAIIKTDDKDINIHAKLLENRGNDEFKIDEKKLNSKHLEFRKFIGGIVGFFVKNQRHINEKSFRKKYKEFLDVVNVKKYHKHGYIRFYLEPNSKYKREDVKKYKFDYISKAEYLKSPFDISKGGLISSGNNINFNVDTINNRLSTIQAKNNLIFKNTNLNNISKNLYKYDILTGSYKYCYKECNSLFHDPDYKWANYSPSISRTKIRSLFSLVQAGEGIAGSLNELNNDNKAKIEFTTFNHSPFIGPTVENAINNEKYILPKNDYSMFIKSKNPDYLIEKNPLYTSKEKFIGSEYFLSKLRYKKGKKLKRLGDGAYETRLVSEELRKKIGKDYLEDRYYLNPNAQFISLMDNGISQSSILNLKIGTPLSKEQQSKLKEDIVWFINKNIDGVDVLIPVVYLVKDHNRLNGSSILAKDIKLDIKGKVYNQGLIKAKNRINIKADSIDNDSGVFRVDGGLELKARDKLVNKNGSLLKAKDIKLTSSSGDIINDTYVEQISKGEKSNNYTYTKLGKTSSIQSANTLTLKATNITNNAELKANDIYLIAKEDINLNAKQLKDEFNSIDKKRFYKSLTTRYIQSNIISGNDILLQANNINLQASKLTTKGDIKLKANHKITSTALLNVDYKDEQTYKGGLLSSQTKRDMSYKEGVLSTTIDANNIHMISNDGIELEASKLNARDKKIAWVNHGDINIFAKQYKQKDLHFKSSSLLGGLMGKQSKDESLYTKVKKSTIDASNSILKADTINLKALSLQTDNLDINAKELNLISDKQSFYHNEYSDNNGLLLREIETKGYIKQSPVDTVINVKNKMFLNKEDITSKLSQDAILKTISSEQKLSIEQINHIKVTLNNKEWHKKTKTLSTIGSLAIQAVATYLTAGAGSVVSANISNVALKAATKAISQSIIEQTTKSLLTSAITGNAPNLNFQDITKGAISAGIVGYTGELSSLTNTDINNLTKQVLTTAKDSVIEAGVDSIVYKQEFKDALTDNLRKNYTNLVGYEAFKYVGDYSAKQELEGNTLFKDGGLAKIALHGSIGASLSYIKGENVLAGAVGASSREALSPLAKNSSDKTQLLLSSIIGATSGALVAGEEGITTGFTIATQGEQYNRQLHQKEIAWLKDDKNIEGFAKQQNISIDEARDRLIKKGLSNIDIVWNIGLGNEDKEAEKYLANINDTFINTRGEKQKLFTAKHSDFYNPGKYANNNKNTDIYKYAQKYLHLNPNELKDRIKDKIKKQTQNLPDTIVQSLEQYGEENKNKSSTNIARDYYVDKIVGLADTTANSYETYTNINNTSNEQFKNIYGDKLGSHVKEIGTKLIIVNAIGGVALNKGKRRRGGKNGDYSGELNVNKNLVEDTKNQIGKNKKDAIIQGDKYYTNPLSIKDARRLSGENKGLIFVKEPQGNFNKDYVKFESKTPGAMSDIKSKQKVVLALRYDNSNPRGNNFIKLDGFEVNGNVLIDRKTNLTTFKKQIDALQRMDRAINQNPEYKVVYEFPNQKAADKASEILKRNRINNIEVRVAQ